jgi:dolichol-phosphate mannosyltransferase
MKKKFSVVIPIYKNAGNLPITVPFVIEQAPILFPEYDFELIMVNDGSPDDSWSIMQEYRRQYPSVIRIASFTRNFGQSAAIYYGLSLATGDVIGVISADLQDPFELFADMLKKWEEGSLLVCGVRNNRNEKGLGVIFSKLTHKMINRFINPDYPEGGYDFYLMDATVRDKLLKIKQKNGQPQISLLWMGVPTCFIGYTRKKREVGKSGWTFSKKIKLFIDIFTTYTYLPLRVISGLGILAAIAALAYTVYLLIAAFLMERTVPGWTTLAVLITFFSGAIMFSLGVIGEYMWRVLDNVKNEPMYLVSDKPDSEEKASEGEND